MPTKTKLPHRKTIAIIGGCGHVGLPLGVKFSLAGEKVILVDINENAVQSVNNGHFPFLEKDGTKELRQALTNGLRATANRAECGEAEVFIFVTGTPVDEHLNPRLSQVTSIFSAYQEYFTPTTLVVMRSTIFPGTMVHLHQQLLSLGVTARLSFCPERVSQGVALQEIETLPQIVSAFDEESFQAAYEVFSVIAPVIIRLTPLEAEIAKLMASAWRYLEFAIANQFYMIAETNGVDFQKVYQAIRHNYPRASGYKTPGLAAGPCLFHDTMQLASYFDNKFYLGHSAMLVNEGLATFIVEKARNALGSNLWGKTIGLLGMTFKANNDDTRESLSFKLKKGFLFQGANVIWHDPYLPESAALENVLQQSDLVVLCTPHREYESLSLSQPLIDVWGVSQRSNIELYPGCKQEEVKT